MQDNKALLSSLQTEQADPRSQSLDMLSPEAFVTLMNQFDREAADAVAKGAPQIAKAIEGIADRLAASGRLYYIGAGTSGRLGVLDASECPPTFGVDASLVTGIIAGGDRALRSAVESAEDNPDAAVADLMNQGFCDKDALVAISASGYAPYCVGGLRHARGLGALSISLACNSDAPMSKEADIAIEVPTGAEILSGSTRLKAGTATKMVLNMLTTGVMVRLGKVYRNLMVDVRATNVKLRDRVVRIVMAATEVSREAAEALLSECDGEVKTAIVRHLTGKDAAACRAALKTSGGRISEAAKKLL